MRIIYTYDEAINLIADKYCCTNNNVKIESPVYGPKIQVPLSSVVEFMVKYNFTYDEFGICLNKINAIRDLRLHCEKLGFEIGLLDAKLAVEIFILLRQKK